MKTMTNPTNTASNPTNTDWVPTKRRRRSRSLWLAPLIMLIVLLAVIAGVAAGESSAKADLEAQLLGMVAPIVPERLVEHTDVRGQPYLWSRHNEMISTAYLYLDRGTDRTEQLLLVQNLDLKTGVAERFRTFVRVPYPDGTPKPQLDRTPNRSQAIIDGQVVTYGAELVGDQVVISAEGGTAPQPVTIAALTNGSNELTGDKRPEVTGVVPIDDFIVVELTSNNVQLGSGH